MKMIRCGCESWLHVTIYAAGLRSTQAEWELGRPTVSHRLGKIAQLSQTDVVLLIKYDVLVIMYYEINTLKCVLHISFGHRVICHWSVITGNL